MDTFGKRLRAAIEKRPPRGRRRGIRLFQEDMEDRREEMRASGKGELIGVALPSIHAYLHDRVSPPEDFVREAAQILGVREAWLAHGPPEPRTEAEVQARGISSEVQWAREAWRKDALEIKQAVLGRPIAADDEFIPYWVGPLADLINNRNFPPYRGGDDKEQLETLSAILREPLILLGLSSEQVNAAAFSDYVMSMIPTLFFLASLSENNNG